MQLENRGNIIISILVGLLIITACTLDEDSIKISTGDHISATPAGAWIDTFNIDFNSDLCIKSQIMDELDANGDIVIDYVVEKEHFSIATVKWKYKGLRLKTEYYTSSPDPIWITIEFDPPIKTRDVIPDHYKQIDLYDPNEYNVTVRSSLDGYRLFLHGSGDLCDAITLF